MPIINSLLKAPTKAARKLSQLIDKDYFKKKLAKRRGKCRKCGDCCGNCRFLDKKTKLCKIYKKRPWNCYQEFPLDKLDQKIWAVKKCGYKFR